MRRAALGCSACISRPLNETSKPRVHMLTPPLLNYTFLYYLYGPINNITHHSTRAVREGKDSSALELRGTFFFSFFFTNFDRRVKSETTTTQWKQIFKSSSLNEVPTHLAGFVHITRDKLQILTDLTYARISGPGRRRVSQSTVWQSQLGYQASDDASFSLPTSQPCCSVSVRRAAYAYCVSIRR